METISGIDRTTDGRLVLTGAAMLPPMEPMQPTRKQATLKGKASKATRDRFGVLNAFVDCSLAGLSRIEIATWLVLYRDTRNGIACTSQADIARRVGCSVRSVQLAVARLQKLRLLVVVYHGGLNRGSSCYRVESFAEVCK